MKRLAAAALIILGFASVLWAAPAPLGTLKALKLLSNDEASQGQAVAFEGTVTYFRGYQNVLFVQDGSDAIFVKASTSAALVPGDRVLVKGVMAPGFRPMVVSSDVTLLHHGSLPEPVPATLDGMIRARYDSMLITLRGVVRSGGQGPRRHSYPCDRRRKCRRVSQQQRCAGSEWAAGRAG
jgi:hypothetical protein